MLIAEAETDGQRAVHGAHRARVQTAHALAQTGFVDGADLLEQDDAVAVEPHAAPLQGNVGGQLRLAGLAGDGRRDDRGAMAVAGVVLDDQHRAHPALLAADHRAQVGKIDISSFDHGCIHTPKNLRPNHRM